MARRILASVPVLVVPYEAYSLTAQLHLGRPWVEGIIRISISGPDYKPGELVGNKTSNSELTLPEPTLTLTDTT
jgi:hypothetical protein